MGALTCVIHILLSLYGSIYRQLFLVRTRRIHVVVLNGPIPSLQCFVDGRRRILLRVYERSDRPGPDGRGSGRTRYNRRVSQTQSPYWHPSSRYVLTTI